MNRSIAIVTCPKCQQRVTLGTVAVRLGGIMTCSNGHQFEYPALKFYNRDGGLKKKYLSTNPEYDLEREEEDEL